MASDKQRDHLVKHKKKTHLSQAIRREFKISRMRQAVKERVTQTRGDDLKQAQDEIAEYLSRNPTPKVY